MAEAAFESRHWLVKWMINRGKVKESSRKSRGKLVEDSRKT